MHVHHRNWRIWGTSLVLLMLGAGIGGASFGCWQSQAEELESLTLTSNSGIPSETNGPTSEALSRLRQALQSLSAGQATVALQHLEELETQLPALADQVLMLRAQAYERLSNLTAAQQTWNALIDQFPSSPLVPPALLGSQRVEELRSRYPAHPVTATALQKLIASQPQNFSLIRELAQHHPRTVGLTALLNRWTQAQQTTLTAADWQIIADAYWEQKEYGKASRAYDLTPLNSQNLYRNGRSHHLSKENAAAIAAYQTVLSQFPTSADAPLTRRRWAEITDAQTAITLLQPLAASQIPDAAEALLSLSQIYTKLNSPQSAQAARQELWKRFPQSDAAAAAAWQISWQQAQAGNLSAAISVAQTIGSAQQDTDIGSQLLYWAGKWQAQQGSTQAAQQTYRQVIEQFPHTYYAWRSAVQLGWPVGDFTSGRLPIQVQFTPAIQALPAVSEAVQTLHLAGLPRAAWERWQWEIDTTDPDLPAEQAFATGVLRNAAGDHLKGINQVAKLRFLEDPSVAGLRQRTDFWQAIYPLHYHDNANNLAGGDPFTQAGMAQWAKKFNLNALLVASLIRQESRFEPEIVSSSGALGLMQVMPSTGKWIADQLGISQYQLTKPADNLYLGSWYLDYTHRTYNNNSLLAVASYNAGPGNVAKWVKNYSLQDPDVFVEQIPFSETRGYVKAVFGNYWNYWQLYTVEGETLVSQSLQR